ncbi:hypothetical protein M0R45_016973 [Rubus argutus]|uniref:Uncharacterized protein n=1 Tax=Rubus argutus TaxID=59490 RepID=A0AAW1XWN1_RUBAR
MKTVQSQVLSSEPISLSDATSFLSNFNKSVCGASAGVSHETCWFLRRALASFEELEQLHQKLKEPRSDRKRRRHGSETRNDDAEATVGDNPAQSFVASRDVSSKPKSHRQQESEDNRKVEVVEQSRGKGGIRNLGEDGGEIAERVGVSVEKREAGDSVEIGGDKMKKKKKKKRDSIGKIDENGGRIEEGDGESEMGNEEVKKEGDFRNSEEDDSQNMKKTKTKKKKKRGNVDENGGENKMENEEVKRQEKKKRKSGVLENGGIDALEEQQEKEKRKKRRKS